MSKLVEEFSSVVININKGIKQLKIKGERDKVSMVRLSDVQKLVNLCSEMSIEITQLESVINTINNIKKSESVEPEPIVPIEVVDPIVDNKLTSNNDDIDIKKLSDDLSSLLAIL